MAAVTKLSPASVILLAVVHVTSSFRHYQSLLPNGGRVTNPCNNKSVWGGVGHQTKDGGSERNPFGIDFGKYEKWTPELCALDSDGDGRTNGEELGDPDCVWKPGAVPTSSQTSHPGICEPMDSPVCKARNSWLSCDQVANLELSFCRHVNNETSSMDLRMSPVKVPSSETTYYCQLFDLNITTDQHMIATRPLITATEVVHHILLFGCDPDADLEEFPRKPYACDMVPHHECRSLIGAWTVGSHGECAHPEMGFRMGEKGYRTVALQIHWNNPRRLADLQDRSGLKIYLTSSLRRHDAGMLVIGQRYMQIDPRNKADGESEDEDGDEMIFSASCPEKCTQVMFNTSIYITSAVNHMHYLGKSQQIKIYKNNTVIGVITDQHNYDYDDPMIYTFPDAIKVNPGDELRTTCTYKRTTKSNPVCWGEATSDEMCFGFITYYPLQSLSHPWCTSMKSVPSCYRHLPSLGKQPIQGCRWWEFRNASNPETIETLGRVLYSCYRNKGKELVCSDQCKAIAINVTSHPCMKNDIGTYMIDRLKLYGTDVKLFLDAVITCSCSNYEYCERKTENGLLGSRLLEICSSTGKMAASIWLSLSCIIFHSLRFSL